ncbi:MAG: oligopeptide transport system substrate-binding protein, partial [Glaciecola sp.]
MQINTLKFLFISLLFSTLTGCTGGETNVSSGNRDGILHIGNGSEPQGLDPHVVTGVPES